MLVGPAAAQDPIGTLARDALGAPAATGERAQLDARRERLRREREAAEARAAALGETLVDLAGDDAKLRADYEAVGARLSQLERTLVAEERALAAILARRRDIAAELAGEREDLAVLLAALQRMGRRAPPALLAHGEPVSVVRGAIAANAALPALQSAAGRLAETLTEAERLAAEARDKSTRIRDNLSEVGEERVRLEGLREELERRRALSVHERDQAAATLVRLSEEAASVDDLIAALERGEVRSAPPSRDFAARRGRLDFPVAGSVIGRYGDALAAGGIAEGLSLEALPRSTVFAPMPATVIHAAPFRSFGNVLILNAGDGYHMVLAGLSDLHVEAGETVETGAPLGRMGRTAPRATTAVRGTSGNGGGAGEGRPTLYVELRRDGAAIDSHGWWRS